MNFKISSLMAAPKDSRQAEPIQSDSDSKTRTSFKEKIQNWRVSSAWIPIWIIKGIGYLPRWVMLVFGNGAGWLFYSFNRKRREIVLKNLDLCFPHWPIEKRQQVTRQHYRYFGQAIVDLGLIWSTSEERLNRYVNLNGLEHCLKAQREGRPIIFITPHVICVDMAATILSQHIPLCSIMKDMRNPLFNAQVIAGRSRFGLKLYKRHGGIGRTVRELKRKGNCFYIPDQDLGKRNSVFVPFYGVQTATLSTLDRMVGITDAIVMPIRAYLDLDTGQYHVTVEQPLPGFPTDNEKTNARLMNAAFEDIIDGAPEQYMWTLRWFKTRPNDGPSLY